MITLIESSTSELISVIKSLVDNGHSVSISNNGSESFSGKVTSVSGNSFNIEESEGFITHFKTIKLVGSDYISNYFKDNLIEINPEENVFNIELK